MKKLAVLDFDNTLFDWVHVWGVCFSAMMAEVTRISGIPLEAMKPEIRAIHQRHGTSEYAFLLSEIPQLKEFCNGRDPSVVFSDAIQAFRNIRREALRLYPTVAETLLRIKGRGARIAIYTESQSFYSFYRTKRLGLDGVASRIFTPPDHEMPADFSANKSRHYQRAFYELTFTEQQHTPPGELKPNPHILSQIVRSFGVDLCDAVYVGDSLHKDVAMARDAGVDCAWAKYGEAQDTESYDLLRTVTHWTNEDVMRENEIRQRPVEAKIILDRSLSQIFDHFEFGEFNS